MTVTKIESISYHIPAGSVRSSRKKTGHWGRSNCEFEKGQMKAVTKARRRAGSSKECSLPNTWEGIGSIFSPVWRTLSNVCSPWNKWLKAAVKRVYCCHATSGWLNSLPDDPAGEDRRAARRAQTPVHPVCAARQRPDASKKCGSNVHRLPNVTGRT